MKSDRFKRATLLKSLTLAGAAGGVVLGAPQAGAEVTFFPVALTGQDAPGMPEGVTLKANSGSSRGLSFPLLNDNGGVYFLGSLIGPGVTTTNDTALWLGAPGNFTPVARENDASPGVPNAVLDAIGPKSFNNDGSLTYAADLGGAGAPSGTDEAFFRRSAAGVDQLFARSGDFVTDAAFGLVYDNLALAGGSRYSTVDEYVAMRARVLGSGVSSGNNEIIALLDQTQTRVLARKGESAPGVPDGAYLTLSNPVVSASGVAAFQGIAIDTSARSFSGVWAGSSPQNLRLVAKGGDPVPGGNGEVFTSVFGEPVINNAGHVAFLTGGSFGFGPENIWSERNGTLQRVVGAGQVAPGTEVDTLFADFGNPLISDSGDIAFIASLTGPSVSSSTRTGVFSEDDGTVRLVARTGFAAPDLRPGITFTGFDDLIFSGGGHVAFTAGITGPGVGFSNNNGIWATDDQGRLRLILFDGQTIDVDPSVDGVDERTINDYGYIVDNAGANGESPSFNDRGQLGVTLQFTDGSEGIFIFDVDGNISNIPGDTDGDGDIDDADLGTAFANYTGAVGAIGGKTAVQGDTDGDGDVDDADLGTAFAGYTGALSPAGASAVPEPASLALLALGGALVARRRRSI